jgi:type I restriction enzyme R subunit
MTTQSEQALENSLIKQLEGMKYERVNIPDEFALFNNLKSQIERHNDITLSDKEFERVLNYLDKGNVFDRAKILRDKMHLVRDDGKSAYIEFINMDKWCQNEFQVANQITNNGEFKNRYDVTILINGLPLVQIELKRRGLELKEAFNQVNRYRRHSYGAARGLFQYIQIFVISNGVNTKYYANTVSYFTDKKQSFKQTFCWADKNNKNINKLDQFATSFLERCHLAKMITKYTVISEVDKILMVLRPYQYYAVEAIIDRVKNTTRNGYIWHTTGSGKTLTAFKASQILIELPEIYKVVFVVDRNDLDYQTIKEFNQFKKDSVDATDDTRMLVKQFEDDTKLIVTTIQKLNCAISKEKHLTKMDKLKDKKIVFIFDECHRSQFGETHKKITQYFKNFQMFGFTGTPIFAENAVGSGADKKTTAQLFEQCLHKYVITDAIGDENVLRFLVEYVGRYKNKIQSENDVDIEVEGIDTRELMESPARIEKIADYIIANHNRKTHSKEFTAIFCVSSIDVLTKYYEAFRKRREEGKHNLKIATIFSYAANEEDSDADGMIGEADVEIGENQPVNIHSRDKLEGYIGDYNKLFGTNFTTKDNKSFYNYYKNIAQRVKERDIDILLVVNMFLTGFDSKSLNTLYVDKNLRYHGLIQAYSRTNRILNEQKSHGNIVVFRNLKKVTDDAVALFSNKDAKDIIFLEPYEEYIAQFNAVLLELRKLAPTPDYVDDMESELEQFAFVSGFRELIRLKNVLNTFADFTFADTRMTAQEFEDYKSKYLDIYDKVRSDNAVEKVSILDDVDFELELIHRDEIGVDYILRLLARYVDANETEQKRIIKNIEDIMSGDVDLRSKRELIEKFITSNLPEISDSTDVENKFETFWQDEQVKEFEKICKEEGLMTDKLQNIIDKYLYTGLKPRRDDLASTLVQKPKVLERDNIIKRLANKVNKFIETFIEGM